MKQKFYTLFVPRFLGKVIGVARQNDEVAKAGSPFWRTPNLSKLNEVEPSAVNFYDPAYFWRDLLSPGNFKSPHRILSLTNRNIQLPEQVAECQCLTDDPFACRLTA